MRMSPQTMRTPPRATRSQSPKVASLSDWHRRAPERSPEQVHGAPPPRCSGSRSGASTPSGSCDTLGGTPGTASARRHDARKAKRAVETDAKAIENRIRYFQKEEEKVWRDLEEVRRQAAAIEGGRSRALEKRLADKAIQQERDAVFLENKARVTERRSHMAVTQERNAAFKDVMIKEKQLAAQRQRMESAEVLQRLRMDEMEARLRNAERACAIQRAQLEARVRNSAQHEQRMARIRQQKEEEWQAAESETAEAESILPKLEAQEMECLLKLQNSRQISQSVLQELEASLGARSPVAALLRTKQKDHSDLTYTPGSINACKTPIDEAEEELPPEESCPDLKPPPCPEAFRGEISARDTRQEL